MVSVNHSNQQGLTQHLHKYVPPRRSKRSLKRRTELHSSTAKKAGGTPWLTTWPDPSALWPTSELPMSPSVGKPTAVPWAWTVLHAKALAVAGTLVWGCNCGHDRLPRARLLSFRRQTDVPNPFLRDTMQPFQAGSMILVQGI